MNNITTVALNDIQNATQKAYQAAQSDLGNVTDLVATAWQCAKDETAAATDNDTRAAVARRFLAIFQGFASLSQDERATLAIPVWSGDRAAIEAMKRKVLDKRPALAAFMLERDAAAKALQERIDRNREAEAKRHNSALPGMLMARIREGGEQLTLDKQGRLLSSPGAFTLVDGGADALREHKDALVSILKSEAEAAAAEAKRLSPVLVG